MAVHSLPLMFYNEVEQGGHIGTRHYGASIQFAWNVTVHSACIQEFSRPLTEENIGRMSVPFPGLRSYRDVRVYWNALRARSAATMCSRFGAEVVCRFRHAT